MPTLLFLLYGWRDRWREKQRAALWLLALESEIIILRESFLTPFGLDLPRMLFQFDYEYAHDDFQENLQRAVAIIKEAAVDADLTDDDNWRRRTEPVDGMDRKTFQEVLHGRELANQYFYLVFAMAEHPSPVRITQKDRLKNLLLVARAGKEQADTILLRIALIKAGYWARLLHYLRIRRIACQSTHDVLMEGVDTILKQV